MRPLLIAGLMAFMLVPAMAAAANSQRSAPTRLLIDKSDRTLTIERPGQPPVVLHNLRFGAGWAHGPKRQRGDMKTPEGRYRVAERRTSGNFTFLPALLLNYPNAEDRALARKAGRDPGDFILIHSPPRGYPTNSQPATDWTDGCISLTRQQLDIVMAASRVGTEILITP